MPRRVFARFFHSHDKFLAMYSPVIAFSWWRSKKSKTPEDVIYETAALKQFHTAAHNSLPWGWTGHVFEPNFRFPQTYDEKEWTNPDTHPWLKFNFKKEPEEYLRAVLDYCFDGNIVSNVEECFDMSASTRWFHMPWQHTSPSGREPVHGTTQERPSPAGWLANTQTRETQTVAVGFYNEPGGYTIGSVWKDPANPNLAPSAFNNGVSFPDGTVSFKLLFTQCTPEEAPYLKDAPKWQTMVQSYNGTQRADPDPPRVVGDVYLLQIDIAVKDPRFDSPTRWNYGSFIYDNSIKDPNPWKRVIPVGLSWGNDPDRTLKEKDDPLKEGWLNPIAKKRIITEARPMVGWANRVNGPADNFASSCHSCHMTPQFPSVGSMVPHIVDGNMELGNREQNYFFRNLLCSAVFDENMDFYAPSPRQEIHPLDYCCSYNRV